MLKRSPPLYLVLATPSPINYACFTLSFCVDVGGEAFPQTRLIFQTNDVEAELALSSANLGSKVKEGEHNVCINSMVMLKVSLLVGDNAMQ